MLFRSLTGKVVAPLLVSGSKAPYTARMTLFGGNHLTEPDLLGASLRLPDGVRLEAENPKILDSRAGVQLDFKDISDQVLKLLKQSDADPSKEREVFRVVLRTHPSGSIPIDATGGVVQFDKPAAKTTTSIKAGAQASVSDRLEAIVTLGVTFPKPSADGKRPFTTVALDLAGGIPAQIKRVTGKTLCASVEASSVVVTGNCNFDVLVRNVRIPSPSDCCDAAPSVLKFTLTERDAKMTEYATGDGPTVRLTSQHRRPDGSKLSVAAP